MLDLRKREANPADTREPDETAYVPDHAPSDALPAGPARRRGRLRVIASGVLLPLAWFAAVTVIAGFVGDAVRPFLGEWALIAYELTELVLGLATLRFVRNPHEGPAVRLPRRASSRLVALAVLAVCVPADLMTLSVNATGFADAAASGTESFPVLFVSAVVLSPLLEEIAFRGVMYGMSRRVMGFWPAAIANGVMFWIMHFNMGKVFNTIPLALISAAVYEATGSLRCGVWIHAVSNLAIYAEMILLLVLGPVAAFAAVPAYAVSIAVLIRFCRRPDRLVAWAGRPKRRRGGARENT